MAISDRREESKPLEAVIHGCRGSFPVAGLEYSRYGGRTACVSIETPEGIIIFDAGTGITPLGDSLAARESLPPIIICFTHFHLDHVTGLPAFAPLLRPDADITLMADSEIALDWRSSVKTLMGKPFWPVALMETRAEVKLKDFPASGKEGVSLFGVDLTWCPVWHPQGCVSYRMSAGGSSVVLATDREHGHADLDEVFMQFCSGTTHLIHDAQYTPEEYPEHRLWGHSTWRHSVEVAQEAGARSLVLTSHEPNRSDEDVDVITEQARAVFSNTRAAEEGLVIAL